MLNGLKHNQDKQSTLENFLITKETTSLKRSSSQLSPTLEEANAKRANMFTEKVTSMQQSSLQLPTNKGVGISLTSTGTTLPSSLSTNPVHQPRKNINDNSLDQLKNSSSTSTTELETNHSKPSSATLDQVSLLKDIVGPLVNEVRDLKDSMQAEYSKLEGIITSQQQTINKLEVTITTKQ